MSGEEAPGEAAAAEAAAEAAADEVESAAEAPETAPAPLVIRRRGRRVTTEPSPGWIGEPEQERTQSRENDDRLRGDVPPHWG
ncbi:hypothetical protein LG314_10640 [Agrococcus terreus]|uniref:hypothetical protein n=1 Tax=Agrococcus terreus TaxID=574649 RepID=UPI003851469F